MSAQDKITMLAEQIRENNFKLMNQVRTLSPQDQKVYSEKVSKLIERTVSTLKKRVVVATQ